LPSGISFTDNASIGGKGGRSSRGIVNYAKPWRLSLIAIAKRSHFRNHAKRNSEVAERAWRIERALAEPRTTPIQQGEFLPKQSLAPKSSFSFFLPFCRFPGLLQVTEAKTTEGSQNSGL
jgi:hypothetical protein